MGDNSHKMGANHSDIAVRLRQTLRDTLSLKDSIDLSFETPLFGALPELDSMAVATLLTEIEDRFGIVIDDDDVDGETFETFGALTSFVEAKVVARRA